MVLFARYLMVESSYVMYLPCCGSSGRSMLCFDSLRMSVYHNF